MKNNIIVVKDLSNIINFDLLISNRLEEKKLFNEYKESRILKLLPYVTECLFGLVNAHNSLYKKLGISFFEDEQLIEDVNKWVSEKVSFDNFNVSESGGVTYKKNHVYLWLSDNKGGARYNNNPIFQSFVVLGCHPTTTQDYVRIKFENFLKSNL